MAAHSESRPPSHQTATRSSRTSWNEYPSGDRGRVSRDALAPDVPNKTTAASMPSPQTHELLDSLETLTDSVREGGSKEAIVETVKRFARAMQKKVAKLGGVAVPGPSSPGRASVPNAAPNDVQSSRYSLPPGRPSLSTSLDGYRPDRDVVAPISVRPNAMELLWICGDCGEHYARARECPEKCTACGAPKQHFYAPIED